MTVTRTEQFAPTYPALFSVDVKDIPGETVLILSGELDVSTQQHFAAALGAVDESVARVVLDLSALRFIDCANIGLIHRWRLRAELRGAQLELRGANRDLERLFQLTDLTSSGPAC